MKNVLVIDDKQEVWDESFHIFKDSKINLHIVGISDAPTNYENLVGFDKIIIHDHGDRGNSFSNRIEFEMLDSINFDSPISVIIVNNDPDTNLQIIRSRWQRFDRFFEIQSFYRLPILPELILASIEGDHTSIEDFSWFKKLKYPARLVDLKTGVLSINEDWTWPENVPSATESQRDRSILIFPSEKDNASYRIVSSLLNNDVVLQSAFPMEGPSQEPDDICEALFRQLSEFGFTRSRLYLIRNVPDSYPMLELVTCHGETYPSDQAVKKSRKSACLNLGKSENGNLVLELDETSTDLIRMVCEKSKKEPIFARASKAYDTSSNAGIREIHKLLNISEKAEVLYISFYENDGRLRGVLAADTGNAELLRNAVLNLIRNLETIQRFLAGYIEAIVAKESKRRAELFHQSRQNLLHISSASSSDSFTETARRFLRQSFEVFPVSLAVLAWTKGENLAPYVVAIEISGDPYSGKQIRKLKELELSVALEEELPAVFHAAKTEEDKYFLTGLPSGDHPNDLNGHRPRCAFPLMLGGKMRGVIGVSVPKNTSRLFSNDIEQLKAIWDVATPTLFYLDQIRSYSERIDITRHDISNTADNISALVSDIENEYVRDMVNDELTDLVGLDGFLATADAGTINSEVFDPAEAIHEPLEFLAKVAKLKRKKIKVDVSVGMASIIGDPGLYRSAVRNIVKNAIEHGDRVGHPDWLEIQISLILEEDELVLTVFNPGKIDSEPPETVSGYRKGSQKALILLEKMLQPYGASIDLYEIRVDNQSLVKACLIWPIKN